MPVVGDAMIDVIAETLRRGGVFKIQMLPGQEPVEVTNVLFVGNEEIILRPRRVSDALGEVDVRELSTEDREALGRQELDALRERHRERHERISKELYDIHDKLGRTLGMDPAVLPSAQGRHDSLEDGPEPILTTECIRVAGAIVASSNVSFDEVESMMTTTCLAILNGTKRAVAIFSGQEPDPREEVVHVKAEDGCSACGARRSEAEGLTDSPDNATCIGCLRELVKRAL